MILKRMFAAAKKDSTLHLEVYDQIGEDWFGEGVTAKSVSKAIKDAGDFASISIRINSPGGSAFEGVAIQNLLRSQGKPINVTVDGVAASAASIIAMAGDSITMGEGAMMMVHNVWTVAMGSADEFRKLADTMDKLSGALAEVYAAKTGKTIEEIRSLMDAETWMSAEEAVNLGFADEVTKRSADEQKQARALAASFRMKFAKAPAFEDAAPEAEPSKEDLSTPPLSEAAADWEGQLSVYRKRLELAGE